MTRINLVALALSALVIVPLGAEAHQTTIYEIGGVEYEVVVGSLGEPVIVDDKTGVDFELVRAGEPVVGVQESLKVELIAGDTKRVMEFAPVYGVEGRYKVNFLATVATTLSYRIFGELEGTAIDLTYTCNPAGHPQAEENTERIEVAPGVIQTLQRGAFGCPQEKASFGFPEPAHDEVGLGDDVHDVAVQRAMHERAMQSTNTIALLGVGLGLAALALTMIRTRRKQQQ